MLSGRKDYDIWLLTMKSSLSSRCWLRTLAVASLATRARISAHDTTPGHAHSSSILMASISSKPLREPLFRRASFSAKLSSVELTSTDPSQPCRRDVSESSREFQDNIDEFIDTAAWESKTDHFLIYALQTKPSSGQDLLILEIWLLARSGCPRSKYRYSTADCANEIIVFNSSGL